MITTFEELQKKQLGLIEQVIELMNQLILLLMERNARLLGFLGKSSFKEVGKAKIK